MHFALLLYALDRILPFPRGYEASDEALFCMSGHFNSQPLPALVSNDARPIMTLCSEERLHHELAGILLPESEEAQSPAAHEAGDPEITGTGSAHATSEEQAKAAKKPASPHKKGSKSAKSGKKGSAAPVGTARAALKEGRENEQRPAKRAKSAQPKPSVPLVLKEPKYVALSSL